MQKISTGKNKATKTKPVRNAPGYRANTARGVRNSPGAGHKSTYPGANHRPYSGGGFTPLAVKRTPRSKTSVDLLVYAKGECLLDTEDKVFKATRDLYPILSKLDGFKDNERWSSKSSVSDVFHHLYNQLVKLKGIDHTLIIENGLYRLKYEKSVHFMDEFPAIPVWWLPSLDGIDNRLYELCFYLVVGLNEGFGFGLWIDETDGYILHNLQENLSYLKTEHSDQQKEILEYSQAYNEHVAKGRATKYCQEIHKAGCSKKVWLKALENYIPETAMSKQIYEWLLIGKKLLTSGSCLSHFDFYPQEMRGAELMEYAEQYGEIPMVPSEYLRFVWRVDDRWWDCYIDMQQSVEHNQGSMPLTYETIIKTAKDFEEDKNGTAENIVEFISASKILEKKYRKTFSDPELLKTKLIKPVYLIDILT